jgi:hypothetical protein
MTSVFLIQLYLYFNNNVYFIKQQNCGFTREKNRFLFGLHFKGKQEFSRTEFRRRHLAAFILLKRSL